MVKLLRKALQIFGFTLLFLLITLNLFIVLSGRFYLYKGIANTYLIGKTGPGIYDLDVFPHSTIPKAKKEFNWIDKTAEVNVDWNDPSFDFMTKYESTSFLLFEGDSLYVEKYWGDHKQETVSNSFSAAKTFIALLIGIAVEEGKINSLDDSVGDYLPAFQSDDKKGITIRHLLWMASGLNWTESGKNPLSENAESYYGNDLYGLVNRQKGISAPGKVFNYQSGNTQLLGFIIEKATGKSISSYFYEKIWSQIGTEHDAYWSLDKENGDEKAFCCLYSTSRDFARLGRLILHEGKWGEKQVIPAWYIREMVHNEQMKTAEGVPNSRYGYQIWTYHHKGEKMIYCRGILGQYIISIPSKNRIIVRTGSKRGENYEIPENKKKDATFVAENREKVGHPIDFFQFLDAADKILKNK